MKYLIKDWTGRRCLTDKEFNSFEDAWEFIYEALPEADDDELGEYYVDEANE